MSAPRNPASSDFFGRGEQSFFDQTLRFTFDLFHGDASFKPVDWRIRITPELSLNDLDVRELGIVSPDVRAGTNRFDTHLGFQEAFVEYKLADLSPNYDFISARAGIQQFNADFRGFLFVDEQPGLRFFGNLHSDKIEYNASLFQFPRKKHQQRPQLLRPPQPATLARQRLSAGFFLPRLHRRIRDRLEQRRRRRPLRR